MGNPRIFVSSFSENLQETLDQFNRTATVEAEYGDVCVEGSVVTLAHHGPRSGNPAPCLWDREVQVEAIGLSHVDLDTCGGVYAIMSVKPENPEFWELAAFVDTNGPHKLPESGASEDTIRQLYAVWAWQQANRVDTRTNKDNPVRELSWEEVFEPHLQALRQILSGDEKLLSQGDALREATETLNAHSFIQCTQGIIVRVAYDFVNHLYNAPDGRLGKAVVTLSTKTHGITVSLESPIKGFSVADFLQDLYGPEAGGHAGIGGTPRGEAMEINDLCRVVSELGARLAAFETE